jgi:hypothetical protein
MQASVAAIDAARVINKTKGDRLIGAFALFAAAIIVTVILGSAVAIREAESPANHTSREKQESVFGYANDTRATDTRADHAGARSR